MGRPTLLFKPCHRLTRRFFRSEKSIPRRPGAGERRILRACALQRTFYYTQFGILRKDDLFKVVLDPGPDKLEKWIPAPAPSKRSTGVTFAQPRRKPSAKLNHSIGCCWHRQFHSVRVRTARVGTGTLARPGRAKPVWLCTLPAVYSIDCGC